MTTTDETTLRMRETLGRLESRLQLPTTQEIATVAQVGQVPSNVDQGTVKKMNRALERGYGGGYDLSRIGEPEPVEAAFLLDHIREILLKWARWPSEHALVIVTLWIAHTWFTDYDGVLLFPATPRLMVLATTGSGKSRIGDLIAGLSRKSELLSGTTSARGLRDALAEGETVLLDEFHKLVGINGQRRQDLLSYVLAYTARSGKSRNGNRDGTNKTHSYAPLAILSQPVIENPSFEDILNRSFVIRPRKPERNPDGTVPKIPLLDDNDDWEKAAETTAEALYLWARAETAEQQKLRPVHSLSERLDSRQYEISAALCAVADRAIDFRYEEGTEERIRWSIAAREAVCGLLLGTDDGKKIMTDIKASLEEFRK
jgi:hypothetical protein